MSLVSEVQLGIDFVLADLIYILIHSEFVREIVGVVDSEVLFVFRRVLESHYGHVHALVKFALLEVLLCLDEMDSHVLN